MQSGEICRNRMGSWRKALKSRVELVFVDAPFTAVQQSSNSVVLRSPGLSWWTWEDLDPMTRPAAAMHYRGWDDAQNTIAEALQEHAPVHGLMGFSQGSCAAALYYAVCMTDVTLPAPQFLILVSGFLPRDIKWAARIQKTILECPSLHAYGLADDLVAPDRSKDLIQAFSASNSTEFVHDGGHMIPTCTGAFRDELRAFLDRQCASPLSVSALVGSTGSGTLSVSEVPAGSTSRHVDR